MTISHPDIESIKPDRAFIYVALGGFTCSICAPSSWTKEEVEEFAEAGMGTDGWQAVDKATLGLGSSTPNPCNQYPGRQHWFMVRNP
jgi:hypothetical protein